MAVFFNKKIRSRYYHNTCFSVEGALVEWVDKGGGDTHNTLATGPMIPNRTLQQQHTIPIASCVSTAIHYILSRGYPLGEWYGKGRTGPLYHINAKIDLW